MMIKVGTEYLDFDGEITLERQIKLFEDIATSDGDFSYSFDVPKTINNTRILSSPFPDNIIKRVYQKIEADIVSNDGVSIYNGYLRIERITNVYSCSFFSGNNNWFSIIDGPLSDLDFSEFDEDLTIANLDASRTRESGVKYSVVDSGMLNVNRKSPVFGLAEMSATIFLKTIFEKIFQSYGIRIQGEMLTEPIYQKAVIAAISGKQEQIDDRSSYVGKTIAQVIPFSTETLITWDTDSEDPYYDGASNNFDLPNNRYVADVIMRLVVDLAIVVSVDLIAGPTTGFILRCYVNGAQVSTTDVFLTELVSGWTFKNTLDLQAGDYVEYTIESGTVIPTVVSGSLKAIPYYVYRTAANSIVPKWTKKQFIKNVLNLFNAIASFDSKTKTLTLNVFDKINDKEPIDLSDYISETEVDYQEFISDYAKNNKLVYQDSGIEEIKKYNSINEGYGTGVIPTENEFLVPEKNIIESDFAAAFNYVNPVFDLPLAKLDFNEYIDGDKTMPVDVILDASGQADIGLPADHGIVVGDFVKITESSIPYYNGVWAVTFSDSDSIHCLDMSFAGDAVLKIVKTISLPKSSSNVYLLFDTGFTPVSDMSSKFFIQIATGLVIDSQNNISLGYFNLPNINKPINEKFTQSVSYGPTVNPDDYQHTLKDLYFKNFARIINDPVKLKSKVSIPYSVFMGIDFLRPMYVKTLETVNLYYLNRITDYQAPYKEATSELIKI